MLSQRSIIIFFLGAILLAWVIPASFIEKGSPLGSLSPVLNSPWAKKVAINDVAWGNGSPYIKITVGDIESPISFSEWSVENERGERAEMGLGVSRVRIGKVHTPEAIILGSSTSAIVSFNTSPIGISFQEHICSGYLRGTKSFTPQLESRCPQLDTHPLWATLDSSCRLLVGALPRCTVVSPEHLGEMSSSCESFLRTVPTFETCIRNSGDGATIPSWRIFVPRHSTFIQEGGGVLYLRDEHGLLVDTFPYETIGIKS